MKTAPVETATEVEVTPEMIEAGAEAMAGYDRDHDTPESIAAEVFRTMTRAADEKSLFIIRYAGPCENETIAVCTSEPAAFGLRDTLDNPAKWEIVEIEPNAIFRESEGAVKSA